MSNQENKQSLGNRWQDGQDNGISIIITAQELKGKVRHSIRTNGEFQLRNKWLTVKRTKWKY